MKDLVKLLSILQLSKEQPLTGYLTAGIKLSEVPTLAEHHYTCALAGYFLCQKIKKAGGSIDADRVLMMLLTHDLSELFGGDISAPLNRKYPDLREYKDKIGERAIGLLAPYLDADNQASFTNLYKEMAAGETDEAVVVKIIDQMDHQFFLEHHSYGQRLLPDSVNYRQKFVQDHIYSLTDKIKDKKTRQVLEDFINEFREHYFNRGFQSSELLMG